MVREMIQVNIMRTFVILIGFLAIFALLISIMPVEFLVGSSDYRQIGVPTYFEAIDLQSFASYYVINLTNSHFQHFWGKEQFGHDMCFHCWYSYLAKWISNNHGYTFWGFYTGGHGMNWINENGTDRGEMLYPSEMDADSHNGTSKYTVSCSHFQMSTWVGYDPTLYNSSTQAWEDSAISVLFAIEFDERGTTLNAWNLLGLLLFFQLPNVHPVINYFFAIPIWICFAVLTAIVIMEVIRTLKPFG